MRHILVLSDLWAPRHPLSLISDTFPSVLLIKFFDGIVAYKYEFCVELLTMQDKADEVTLSPEEQKDMANWYKQQVWESIARLEPYGVSYDEEQNLLFYQGKKVRLLIDEQIKDTYETLQMSDGEIDLYTVRAEDFRLTGVRVATREEYDANTKEMEEVKEDVMQIEIDEPAEVEQTYAVGEYHAEESEQKKISEYKKAGIEPDSQGGWLWNGKKVDWLIDENYSE